MFLLVLFVLCDFVMFPIISLTSLPCFLPYIFKSQYLSLLYVTE